MNVKNLTEETLPGAIEAICSLPEYFYERDIEKAKENYMKYTKGQLNDSLFLVATEGSQVLGVTGAIGRLDADQVYYLASFAVHRESRSKGIGRKLLSALENELQRLGARLLFTETSTASYCDETRAFYQACGYSEVAVIEDYWTKNDTLSIYLKRLRKD